MKINTIQTIIATTFIVGAVALAQEVNAEEQTTSIYRLYNKNTGEHFYTRSRTEQFSAIRAGWKNEGVGWVAPIHSNTPIYRVYNPNATGGDHYYTKSKYEAQSLVNKGWRWDDNGKPVFYSGGQSSVYVAYNPNAQSGSHNYTPNSFEQQSLLSNGWKYGATAWNAVSKFNWTLAQYNSLIVGDSYSGVGGTNYNSVLSGHDIPTNIIDFNSPNYTTKTISFDNTKWNFDSNSSYKYITMTFVKQPNGDYLLSSKYCAYLK